jgi:GINS complex subunit 2
MDDIPHADETRTLIKDIWDLRIAKLRSSIDTFVKSDATHAKVRGGFVYLGIFSTFV